MTVLKGPRNKELTVDWPARVPNEVRTDLPQLGRPVFVGLGGNTDAACAARRWIEQALLARDRLLEAVGRWSQDPASPAHGITVSSGMAEYAGEEPVEETLGRADQAMRKLKVDRAVRA